MFYEAKDVHMVCPMKKHMLFFNFHLIVYVRVGVEKLKRKQLFPGDYHTER